MLRKIEGTVASYKAHDVRHVEVWLQGSNKVINLHLDSPWVLRDGDEICVTGEDDGRSGRFNGYAYRNSSRGTCGVSQRPWNVAARYIGLGLLFSWAIFPLFIHVPEGVRQILFGRKVERAAHMLDCCFS